MFSILYCILKQKNQEDNESGGNLKDCPGKEDGVVRACDEKRGALCVNRATGMDLIGRRRRELNRVRNDIREKGLLGESTT